MSDMLIIFVFVLIVAVTSMIFAYLLQKWRSNWSAWKMMLVVSLPIPLISTILGLFLYFSTMAASVDECGVDACAMVVYAVIVIVPFAAISSFLTSWVSCNIVARYCLKK